MEIDPIIIEVESNVDNERQNEPQSESEAKHVTICDAEEHMHKLNYKLKKILMCVVCKGLKRLFMYQCKNGHLICEACIRCIIAESKTENELATCLQCQAAIHKDSYSRNIAVENAILELSRTCSYCDMEIPSDCFKDHSTMLCQKRFVNCCNNGIGCDWTGSPPEKPEHEKGCTFPSALGKDILTKLTAHENKRALELSHYENIYRLLSSGSFFPFDLQFKAIVTTVDSTSTTYYETSVFSAFKNYFMLNGVFNEETSEFSYRVVLKSECRTRLNLHYVLVRGPYSDMNIIPTLCQFTFDEHSMESPFQVLDFSSPVNVKACFYARRVNFRIFVFLK